jgi:hypothetical protein
VVVHNLYIFRACVGPTEADSVLIVDSDAVLAEAITFQCFKTVARRNAQILQHSGNLELSKLSSSNVLNTGKPLNRLATRQGFRMLAFE